MSRKIKDGELYIIRSGAKRRAKYINCNNCGKKILRAKSDIKDYKNYYCSKQCRGEKSKKRVILTCDYCKKDFERVIGKVNRSKNNLNFCSKDCRNKAQRLDCKILPNSNYKSGKYAYRDMAFRKYGKICSHCGYNEFEEGLDVHHIDGDKNNNKVDNLLVLCGTHHMLVTRGIFEVINRKLALVV